MKHARISALVAALFIAIGPAWWCYLGCVALMIAAGVDQTRFAGGHWTHGLLLPVGVAVFSYILLRSMFVTHRTGGITWRGTHYPLAQLKANVV